MVASPQQREREREIEQVARLMGIEEKFQLGLERSRDVATRPAGHRFTILRNYGFDAQPSINIRVFKIETLLNMM